MEEKKRGWFSSIRYWLAPKDLYENISKLTEELEKYKVKAKVEEEGKNFFKGEAHRKDNLFQEAQKKIIILETEIERLKEIKTNIAPEKKEPSPSDIIDRLNFKQKEIFNFLSKGTEKSYSEILNHINSINGIEIKDIPALRVQMSRLGKKLKGTPFQINKVTKGNDYYFKVGD